MPKMLKWVLYPAFFFAVLFTSFYLNFPMDALKGRVVDALETNLGRGKEGRHGVPPKVTIGKLSPWRLSGIDAKNVTIRLKSSNPTPGMEIPIDRLKVRVGLFSLLGDPTITVDADLYGGNLSGDVSVDKKGAVKAVDLELSRVNMALLPLLEAEKPAGAEGPVYLPKTGRLNAKVDLDLGENPAKNASGSITLKGEGLSIGEGKLKVAGFGLTLPVVSMGTLDGNLKIKDGKGTTDVFKLAGGDVAADFKLGLTFSKRLAASRISGDGWFKIEDAFLDANGKFKTALNLAQQVNKKMKADKKGRFNARIGGSLQRPSFSLMKSRRSKKKRGK